MEEPQLEMSRLGSDPDGPMITLVQSNEPQRDKNTHNVHILSEQQLEDQHLQPPTLTECINQTQLEQQQQSLHLLGLQPQQPQTRLTLQLQPQEHSPQLEKNTRDQHCLVCNAKLGVSARGARQILSDKVKTTQRQMQVGTALGNIINHQITVEYLNSLIICMKCFNLIDNIDSLEGQLVNMKQVVTEKYMRTLALVMDGKRLPATTRSSLICSPPSTSHTQEEVEEQEINIQDTSLAKDDRDFKVYMAHGKPGPSSPCMCQDVLEGVNNASFESHLDDVPESAIEKTARQGLYNSSKTIIDKVGAQDVLEGVNNASFESHLDEVPESAIEKTAGQVLYNSSETIIDKDGAQGDYICSCIHSVNQGLKNPKICKTKGSSYLFLLPITVFILLPATFLITYSISVLLGHTVPVLPYISDTATDPPESCIFGQLLNICAFFIFMTVYVKYRQISELYRNHSSTSKILKLNRTGLWLGSLGALGISIIGNFQVTNVFFVHVTGALMALGLGTAYIWVQAMCSYQTHPMVNSLPMAHIRLAVAVFATILFIVGFISALIAHSLFKGDDATKWNPGDGGWAIHVVSTSSEWVGATCFSIFMLTLVDEFKLISMDHPLVYVSVETLSTA